MMERLRHILAGSDRMVFFGGAGVSTESGIPDFRSETGLFRARQAYGASPETLLSYDYFIRHPREFYRYYAENLIFPHVQPNGAHYALAQLEKEGRLAAVVTQNIDGLHQRAGSQRVFELHGSTAKNSCMSCGADYSLAALLTEIGKSGIPYCTRCAGMIRPHVVLYGESLDPHVMEGARKAIGNADTLIVGGTSLAVWPAAGLLQAFRGDHLVLINKTETPFDSYADLVIHQPIGQVLSKAVLAQ